MQRRSLYQPGGGYRILNEMSPRTTTHLKQIVLFLLAVLLPTLVLAAFTLRMVGQEEELAEKRAVEQARYRIQNIATNLLASLERVKMDEAAVDDDSLRLRRFRHPGVSLVTRVDERKLHLPWDRSRTSSQSPLLASRFVERIRNGEQEEFSAGNMEGATGIYRTLMEQAGDPTQSAYARLLLARTLQKSGSRDEALSEYTTLASEPPSLIDEYGIPLASYGCEQLLRSGTGGEETLQFVNRTLSMESWLAPEAAYRLQGLVLKARELDHDNQLAVGFQPILDELKSQISDIEQILALQREYPKRRDLHEETTASNRPATWTLFGERPWLISTISSSERTKASLVAVRLEAVPGLLVQGVGTPAVPFDGFSLAYGLGEEGEPLGSSFPGLRIILAPDDEALVAGAGRRYIYLGILFVVIGIACFGAYLLWRDVRREVRLSELRTQFVSSVSHELKTPLTAIKIFAETLQLGRSKNAAKQKEYLDTIVDESERLTRLINNVLDFSRIEKAGRTYSFQSMSLSEIIEACEQVLRYPLKQQGFNLSVVDHQDLPPVMVDRDAMEQAILNLLNNAIKYSGDSREIELRLARVDSHAVIQVRDFGIGIEPADHRRIFKRFYRTDSAAREGTTGAGIGLAVADSIVTAHGGRIEVQSAPGEGSTFSIFLKLETQS